MSIPKIQIAAVIPKPGAAIEIREDYPVIQSEGLQPGECLVKMHCSGVCHTGRSILVTLSLVEVIPLLQICTSRKTTGPSPASRSCLFLSGISVRSFLHSPLIGGHEGVGEIVAIGKHTQDSPVKIGDRVGIKWLAYSCLQCEFVGFFVTSNLRLQSLTQYPSSTVP